MKGFKFFIAILLMAAIFCGCSRKSSNLQVFSPNGKIEVKSWIDQHNGILKYSVSYQGQVVLNPSSLGLSRDDCDFSSNLTLMGISSPERVTDDYVMKHGKKSRIHYEANEAVVHTQNRDGQKMDLVFRVSDDGVAFRYIFPEHSDNVVKIIAENTSFNLPEGTKGWLQPMSKAKTGFAGTNPSYEEPYLQEVSADTSSPTGYGWVYPALFKCGEVWLLISETALDRHYCGTHLDNNGFEYRVAFPQPEEIFPGGELLPNNTLPWYSPWRIIAVGELKTIVESTLGTDLANPAAIDGDFSFVEPGLASWSWVILKDESVNFETQKKFIDFAAEMKWPYCLVDGLWDQQIGRDRIAKLSEYAQSKGVGLLLWYNSAGSWNTAYQTPKNKMLTHESRVKEFEWMKKIGIKGIKVDFFGGDGQSMIAYYHDILQDAANYGILVNFHGSTLPRGWHRTYPHLMTMEAIKGYEFITFSQETADMAPAHMAMVPFARNVFDPMDFTPVNLSGVPNIERRTTNGFELATSVIFTSGIQHIAETDMGIQTVPDYVKNFLKRFPNGCWDETLFIDGYPGKLAVIARRKENTWYVGGINGENIEKNLALPLPFLQGNKDARLITDGNDGIFSFAKEDIELAEDEKFEISLQPNGGFVLVVEE
ncbi:glycoside hydrolase family 97 protein [Thermophagus xiamenensis]|uniref:Glycosyl-hydrolase 97 C-terminal, oligomerisation n=1 Tax=Thermophagus xiamenensis TaxID=385682 RepID=A0A1I2A671_9BACT|nr:glycoside hydrolase family 97 protein [Thermophagus xiamenensis]SFE38393.1 Glycosyl-hydrolase 97 C-terminal, oligomerisation [Thermophagus xiamenensis]